MSFKSFCFQSDACFSFLAASFRISFSASLTFESSSSDLTAIRRLLLLASYSFFVSASTMSCICCFSSASLSLIPSTSSGLMLIILSSNDRLASHASSALKSAAFNWFISCEIVVSSDMLLSDGRFLFGDSFLMTCTRKEACSSCSLSFFTSCSFEACVFIVSSNISSNFLCALFNSFSNELFFSFMFRMVSS